MARRGVPYYERLQRMRRQPMLGYGAALAWPFLAAALQWGLRDFLATGRSARSISP
jgi:hypothetical protein